MFFSTPKTGPSLLFLQVSLFLLDPAFSSKLLSFKSIRRISEDQLSTNNAHIDSLLISMIGLIFLQKIVAYINSLINQ